MKLNLKLASLSWLTLLAMLAVSGMLQAKPSAPISFSHDVPESVDSGENTTTTLRVVSKVPLTSLEVVVRPYQGTELPDGDQTFSFTDLQAGEAHTVSFEVRLTSTAGYISVTGRTLEPGGREQQKVVAIRYATHTP